MHDYILLFLHALVVTVIIESMVLFAFIFLLRFNKLTVKLLFRVFSTGIIASCITLPFVWFVFPGIIEKRTYFLVVAELFAFAAEIPVIRNIIKTGWFEAAAASFLANGISFVSGYFLQLS